MQQIKSSIIQVPLSFLENNILQGWKIAFNNQLIIILLWSIDSKVFPSSFAILIQTLNNFIFTLIVQQEQQQQLNHKIFVLISLLITYYYSVIKYTQIIRFQDFSKIKAEYEMETFYKNKQFFSTSFKQMNCKGQKCSKCQKFYNNTLQQIENQIYCKECIKCHQCNKLGPRSMSGSFFLHDNCIEISKNSSLRKELIAFIKLKFATKTKQADNNNKIMYFYCDPYPFLNLPDYLGYIIGYNHPLLKDQIQIGPKKHKITQDQADKYLETDLDQFEIQLYEYYQRNKRKIEDIPENIRMLMLSVLFIFKDFQTVQELAFLQTFDHLYYQIDKFQYPKTKGPNILKIQIEKVLDFFKDRFHRRDGTVRQQYFINDFRKILPIKKRN